MVLLGVDSLYSSLFVDGQPNLLYVWVWLSLRFVRLCEGSWLSYDRTAGWN